MCRFSVGDELYWTDKNIKITVDFVFHKQCSYSFINPNSGEKTTAPERELFSSNIISPLSTYRVEDTVFYIPEKRGEKTVEYIIKEIYKEDDSIHTFYKCVDSAGNEKVFIFRQISFSEKTHSSR